MNDHEAVSKGQRAKHELDLTGEAFDKLEAAMIEHLIAAPIGSDQLIGRLHAGLQTVRAIRSAMREMIDNGRIAEHALALANSTFLKPN